MQHIPSLLGELGFETRDQRFSSDYSKCLPNGAEIAVMINPGEDRAMVVVYSPEGQISSDFHFENASQGVIRATLEQIIKENS